MLRSANTAAPAMRHPLPLALHRVWEGGGANQCFEVFHDAQFFFLANIRQGCAPTEIYIILRLELTPQTLQSGRSPSATISTTSLWF
jgi:hypothetical protein